MFLFTLDFTLWKTPRRVIVDLDFSIIKQALPHYEDAMAVTLRLGLLGILLSLVLGFVVSLFMLFKVPVLSQISRAYVELARNTPLLIQLFFLYYGLPKIGVNLSKEACGIIGLTFLGGGYMGESFRSGFSEVPRIQLESGKAIGLTKFQMIKHVIFPQGLILSVSNIGANALFLLKETSVFSAIAIMDLTNVTKDLIGMYYRTNEYLFSLVVAYAIILLPMAGLIMLIERRIRYGSFGY
jgi:polar amino acid transport system permease protein